MFCKILQGNLIFARCLIAAIILLAATPFPSFSDGIQRAWATSLKSACNYKEDRQLQYFIPMMKFYPTSLSRYNNGLVIKICATDNVSVYMRLNCIHQVAYILQFDNTYKKASSFDRTSPVAKFCNKYF